LDQNRKNQKSTKPSKTEKPENADDPFTGSHDSVKFEPEPEPDDPFPTGIEETNANHSCCYVSIFEPTGQVYTDQTGKFVHPSSSGNNYMLVLYDYDSNSILAEPMKTKSASHILAAYETLYKQLVRAGHKPKLQRLDNECSKELKEFFHENSIAFQLVPPGVHRANAAERAIRTWKNHFIAGLCSMDKNFPIHLWCKIVPHAVLSLNLLRGSRINPKHSAWSQLNGPFDYDAHPLAPPGIRVLVHDKPSNRSTWSPHASDGWYLGPAMEAYRCHRIWVWTTRSERISDTVAWIPTKVNMPIANTNDLVLAGLKDITNALQNAASTDPLAPTRPSHVKALHDLATLLTGIAVDNAPPSPTAEATPQRVATVPKLAQDPPPHGLLLPPHPTSRRHTSEGGHCPKTRARPATTRFIVASASNRRCHTSEGGHSRHNTHRNLRINNWPPGKTQSQIATTTHAIVQAASTERTHRRP
jgi:hypothetical protein